MIPVQRLGDDFEALAPFLRGDGDVAWWQIVPGSESGQDTELIRRCVLQFKGARRGGFYRLADRRRSPANGVSLFPPAVSTPSFTSSREMNSSG